MTDNVKVVIYEKNGVELEFQEELELSAENVTFDPTATDFISDNVQGVIEELEDKVGVSASPGFSWGRSGNLSLNTWLQNDGVASNRAGRTVNLIDPVITAYSIANEDINTFDISFYEHEGDSINLVLIGTITVVSSRSQSGFINFAITEGKQLAVRVTSGSAKNVVVGLNLSGTIA